MLSNLRTRLISATYSAPLRNATPLGLFNPFATTITSSAFWFPSLSTRAYTLPSPRDPTNTVPRSPSVKERAPGTSAAYIRIENPGGTRTDLRFDAVWQATGEENRRESINRKGPNRVGTRFMRVPYLFGFRYAPD